jgi:hypothetical protein
MFVKAFAAPGMATFTKGLFPTIVAPRAGCQVSEPAWGDLGAFFLAGL